MPFPLAHPAAILPLRRYCPRQFNFPALVAGSLCPDIGYGFGRLHLGVFSHRFLAGTFGFCLPVGLVLVLVFYLVRRPVVQRLPARCRRIFEPFCLRPAGSLLIIIVSVLVGTWIHLFLDAFTHKNGWFVQCLPILQALLIAGNCQIRVHDLLYDAVTFGGVFYAGLAYLNWLEWAAGNPAWVFPGFKWVATLILAALTLLLSILNHDEPALPALLAIGVLTAMLVGGFLAVTGWALMSEE